MRESQRLFLQVLMSKQFLSEKETKDIYKKACAEFGGTINMAFYTNTFPHGNRYISRNNPLGVFLFLDDSPPENFAGFLEAINKNLGAFDMEIRRGVSEDDGTVYFGLVSTGFIPCSRCIQANENIQPIRIEFHRPSHPLVSTSLTPPIHCSCSKSLSEVNKNAICSFNISIIETSSCRTCMQR